jgi:uncharacterized protein YyaL (SSP411 family)
MSILLFDMPQPNALLHTTSPYLLQHAYQPVDWYPWDKEALDKAQQEDKPILLSIGYSSCHWCHVMSKESFENEGIAAIMNQHFVCIKVDREERPDIDHVYIEALQAMGIQAGWPLHAFLLPNQQPFYGGTYFSPSIWKELLENVIQAFQIHRNQLETSAFHFTQALQKPVSNDYILDDLEHTFTGGDIHLLFEQVYQQLDHEKGGMQGTAKFPMPSLHVFILDYYRWNKEERALGQLELTLQNMAYGGIYDQLAGGFARYALDKNWRIPHFEKMLYDNAQLISLYAQAYPKTQHHLYKEVIEQTISFIEREMMGTNGGFHSALDADSEGVEGKFYIWTQAEIEQIVGEDALLISHYYHITKPGNWEKGYNILYRSLGESNQIPGLNKNSSQNKLKKAKIKLLNHRNQRPKPALDDKILTSWNGMMVQALVDAYYALGNPHYLALAKTNALFIDHHLLLDNQLYHSYRQGKVGVYAYLEDYAWLIRAYSSLYQATFEEAWLDKAAGLISYVIKHYWNPEKRLFYFTDEKSHDLLTRPQEIFDQVIPSSNAVMAHNLFELGVLLTQEELIDQAKKMLAGIFPLLKRSPSYLSHWASLYVKELQGATTVAIMGPDCLPWAKAVKQNYPGAFVLGSLTSSNLPLLADKKAINGQTNIYICHRKTCLPPIHTLAEALDQLNVLLAH